MLPDLSFVNIFYKNPSLQEEISLKKSACQLIHDERILEKMNVKQKVNIYKRQIFLRIDTLS